jgi:hypothetical protein
MDFTEIAGEIYIVLIIFAICNINPPLALASYGQMIFQLF